MMIESAKRKPLSMQTRLNTIYSKLYSRYGNLHWWPAQTPYEMIVGAILTQNTAWSNVDKAIANFGGDVSPARVLSLPTDDLADIIHSAGFFNQKARYLHEVTHWFERYGFSVETVSRLPLERVRSELLSLKGVGRETADSILLYAFSFPSFVVDAYTMRLLSRLPIDVEKSYDVVKALFESNLPQDAALYNNYHAMIVINAKDHCRKKNVCEGCPLAEVCGQGQGSEL
jgi:endonuclease-3 related protein